VLDVATKPLFLLADSQLLFSTAGGVPFVRRIREELQNPQGARAAYLGASNGDAPEFFELFRAAMDAIGVTDCCHVHAEVDEQSLAFLDSADLILLAGGDVEVGWQAFEKAGLVDRLRARARDGAVLVGVSAGAVQLGTCVSVGGNRTLSLLSLVPYAVGAHQEPDWDSLVCTVKQGEGSVVGIGICAGAGVVVHRDLSVEPVRKPLVEVSLRGGELRVTEVISMPAPADESPADAALLN
jgi:cyanophycinase